MVINRVFTTRSVTRSLFLRLYHLNPAMPNINKPVPGAHEYYPLSEPPIGTYHDTEDKRPALFRPLQIKEVKFKNRIFVSPMCQYSSSDGHATDWHFVHIGGFATRGVGAICMEATAVVPEGRISPEDAGLWTDSQMEPLKKIVRFSHAHGTKIGVQLAHAGRKASTYAPWVKPQGKGESWVAQENENGWPDKVSAPSDIPYSETYPQPKAMTEDDMKHLEDAFVAALKRCEQIGFDFIEIHAAHGYLLHEFVSPLSNIRTDQYGGSLENRLRFPLRLLQRCREAWKDKPLFVRISASDWKEGPEKAEDGTWLQWGIEQSNIWVAEMLRLGVVDLLDASSGANWAKQKIPLYPGYQVPFAEAIKKAHPSLPVGAVGLITDPVVAESYLQSGKADVVFLARELLRNPHWALLAAQKLGSKVKPANQYERAWL
ncbi:NADH:flavin oxidoreductase 2 [Mycena rebaudengoi]|nr:NADH:flavin oxidoreductase 2 [Mycena rebaudengoi]